MQSIEHLYRSFWTAITRNAFNQPNLTDCLNLLDSVELTTPNPKIRERINWLHENTCEGFNQPLAVLEYVLFKNWQKGCNHEVDIYGKTYTLTQLFLFGNKLLTECCRLMTEMTKNYSFDIKYGNDDGTQPLGEFSLGTPNPKKQM